MRKKRHLITFEDRKIIEKMRNDGASVRKIGAAVGSHYVTIGRELHRCPDGKYTAEEAQHKLQG